VASSFDLPATSLVDLCRALAARRISALELMQHTLAAIDRAEPILLAVICRRATDDLLAEARAAQARIDAGRARPLEAIPFGVKDLEDVAGLVTSHGSKLFAHHVAAHDSTQVARLRAAGAIVVGKTNTAEFGSGALTKNLVHGATASPWDPARSPGGSSGGSAAALAAGVLPLVTAHDGGGSIRVPASFVGAFGMKPTFGRVPTGPAELWDPSATIVYGPLTRTVTDAALILDQVVGLDPLDTASLPAPGFRYLDRIAEPLPGELRIAYSRDLGGVPVQPDIADTVERAVDQLSRLGHRVTEIAAGPPDLGMYWQLLLARHLDGWFGDRLAGREDQLTHAVARAIEAARAATPAYWGQQARARMDAVRWFARAFADHDLLVTPSVPCDPPPVRGPLPTHVGDAPLPLSGVAAFTLAASFAGLPAASLRAGRSRAGFPVGLQILGPRDADDLVLRTARAFEREQPTPDWPRVDR
jgi:Asp-tRNA(Asn)/Glu-tRNA(Gln) amidotransferase A subunit family amidase